MSEAFTPLMRALEFTPEDLAANRDGQLSARQREAMHTRRTRLIMIGLAAALVGAVAAALCLQFGRRSDAPILTIIGIGLTVLDALLIGVFGRQIMRLNADLRGGAVKRACGEAVLTVRVITRRASLYIVRVGDSSDPAHYVESAVSLPTFEAFRERKPYCVYSAPHSGTLLSAESVG
jgi:hypothetical protein